MPRSGPAAAAIGLTLLAVWWATGVWYDLHWNALPNTSRYEILESTDATAATPAILTSTDVTLSLHHDVAALTRFHYRVRAVSNCG